MKLKKIRLNLSLHMFCTSVSSLQNRIIYCSIVETFHVIAVFVWVVGNVWKIPLCRKNVKFSRKFTKFGKLTGHINPNLFMQVDFLNFQKYFTEPYQSRNFWVFYYFGQNFKSDSHRMEKKNISKIPAYRSCITSKSTNINKFGSIW